MEPFLRKEAFFRHKQREQVISWRKEYGTY